MFTNIFHTMTRLPEDKKTRLENISLAFDAEFSVTSSFKLICCLWHVNVTQKIITKVKKQITSKMITSSLKNKNNETKIF